jgi:DNA repair exonuclease SbcCD ATPase subunit
MEGDMNRLKGDMNRMKEYYDNKIWEQEERAERLALELRTREEEVKQLKEWQEKATKKAETLTRQLLDKTRLLEEKEATLQEVTQARDRLEQDLKKVPFPSFDRNLFAKFPPKTAPQKAGDAVQGVNHGEAKKRRGDNTTGSAPKK